jgi:serine/threonine protein kinase
MSVYADEGSLMPIADVLRIGNAIAGALDYAHRQGVVHRDIKPSNVLIAKDGRVLLSDFGMALEVRDGSMGNIFGTPHYISPEQARRSADAVPQSDLYSLGVILYEILTGSVPFNDPSPASIALQHITEPPPPPRSINPEISPAVEAVILKALEKDPQNRYQSGAKLMSALEESFKGTASSPKIPLPPLPVGAPTIQRSNTTISQIAKREAPKKPSPPAAELPATVRASSRFQPKRSWIYGFLILLLLGFGYWYSTQNRSPFAAALPTLTVTPTRQNPTKPVPLAATQTDAPPATGIPTATIPPTTTYTAAPSATASPTLSPATATVKYPNGYHFSLLWNETSFYVLNRSREPRSFSGFAFERLDLNSAPIGRFDGAEWNNKNYTYIARNRCASIKIFGDQDPPYLDPIECLAYVGFAQPRKDEIDQHLIFWNPREGSIQFRVLWVDEEIARCDISAEVCEIYVP